MILRKTLSRLVAIAPRRERVAAPLMALLLVSTAVGAPIGTAAAASSTEECSGVDAIIYDMTTIDGFFSMQDKEDHPCSPKYQRAQAIEELKNDSASQEKLDIYNAGLAQKSNNEVFTDVSANYLNDTRSIAWMHAESALAECYQDGKSKSVCKSEAKQAIQDYYAAKQVNQIERWNVSRQAIVDMAETAKNQSGIGSEYVHTYADTGVDKENSISGTADPDTETLVNGSTHQVAALWVDRKDGFGGDISLVDPKADSTEVSGSWTIRGVDVKPPNEDYSEIRVISPGKMHARYEKISTLNSDLQSEVDPFVNSTWEAFQNDQIQAYDVISRNNLMFRYGTDALNNTNQSLYDSTAALATMGLDTPNLNSTGSMTVVYDGSEYTGMVLAQEAPNGTWETNRTYNTENIGGTVLLATTDGQRIDMKGNFTLKAMKNQDGDEIEETQATKVVYRTSNTTELLENDGEH